VSYKTQKRKQSQGGLILRSPKMRYNFLEL